MGDLIAEHFIHQSDWDVVAYTADADYVEGDTHNALPLVPFFLCCLEGVLRGSS